MAEVHDIFVSYARLDDQPLPGVEIGWVTNLVRGLRIQLARQMGRADDFDLWMDHRLAGNDAVTPKIETALAASRTILICLSKPYLASRWCQKELQEFLERHAIQSHRVFVIEPEPVDRPEALHDLLGYRFWEKSPEGQVIRWGWPTPDPQQLPYYERIDDLARDLAKILAEADPHSPAGTSPSVAPPPGDAVFLAESSADLSRERETMRRFLEQQGLRVLPLAAYPSMTQARLETRLQQEMAGCKLYLQLLSTDDQGGLAAVYHRTAERAGIPRLLWRPRGLDLAQVADADHVALLKSADIVVSDQVELQREVQRRLRPPPPSRSPGNDLFLFVNHAREDGCHLQPLLKELKERGIGYIHPLPEPAQPDKALQDWEVNVLDCDALLMLCYQTEVEWVRGQVRLLRRSLAKREQPIRGIGICHEPGIELGVALPQLVQIACANRCPITCIETFLREIQP